MKIYQVIDRQTGQVTKEYNTRIKASRAVDRLDTQYGACRYWAKMVIVSEDHELYSKE